MSKMSVSLLADASAGYHQLVQAKITENREPSTAPTISKDASSPLISAAHAVFSPYDQKKSSTPDRQPEIHQHDIFSRTSLATSVPSSQTIFSVPTCTAADAVASVQPSEISNLDSNQIGLRQGDASTKCESEGFVEELDCVQAQNSSSSGSSGQAQSLTWSIQGGAMQAMAALGSILVFSLNPINLFGLSTSCSLKSAEGSSPTPNYLGDDWQAEGVRREKGKAVGGSSWYASCQPTKAEEIIAAKKFILNAEQVMMWRDPWRSLRVLGLGLYVALFLFQLASGGLLVHPGTLVLGVALLYLVLNAVHTVRSLSQQGCNELCSSDDADMGRVADGTSVVKAAVPGRHSRSLKSREDEILEEDQELKVYFMVQGVLQAACAVLIPAIAAAAALLHRALSGRRLVSSALAGACLWCGMLLGELGVLPPMAMTVTAYLVAFAVPALYVRSRCEQGGGNKSFLTKGVARVVGLLLSDMDMHFHVIFKFNREGLDVLVEDAVRLLLRLVLHSSWFSLMSAAAAAFAVMVWVGGFSVVVKASAAVLTSLVILLWNAQPRKS
ncbi:hypothetical protein CEUSTIGMA_g2080.t1 [Chlamydomonas eustigma]|uniref:Uncharacterized protein n=1 Tax=Chlamydomonas eustigma TaxID=1157962 RepID=A0A250WVI5_9CHLO|nr:hypothetical protein CEUSTIGMA_g2080.t1 [Chlamydomonas eustigma]|eukprot:GAX74632.1 hypothetical protein CEUSTIGMA_g2080.t1 [Chlamydomonas eustigma]